MQQPQPAALPADLVAERAAARAIADVAAERGAPSAPPRSVASCSRISTHGVSRAAAGGERGPRLEHERLHLLARAREFRAISSYGMPPSSASTMAVRWASGSRATSVRSARRSSRVVTSANRSSVAASTGSRQGARAERATWRDSGGGRSRTARDEARAESRRARARYRRSGTSAASRPRPRPGREHVPAEREHGPPVTLEQCLESRPEPAWTCSASRRSEASRRAAGHASRLRGVIAPSALIVPEHPARSPEKLDPGNASMVLARAGARFDAADSWKI